MRAAAPHADHGAPTRALAVKEGGDPRRKRGRDHRLDAEVAALDGEHEVAGGGRLRRHHVEVDAEPFADHAAGLDDVGLAVQRIAGRQGVHHRAPGANRMGARGGEHALHVGRRDRAAAHRARALEMLGAEPPAG